MKLEQEKDDIVFYLEKTDIIDYDHEDIVEISETLRKGTNSQHDLIKKIYEFVRDNISHSVDAGETAVTLKASDVLRQGHGFCFAKSHLLAAIFRYLGIPAGFCYQKISCSVRMHRKLVLHGLCAVFLENPLGDPKGKQPDNSGKWIRLDCRGNKMGVNAQFFPEKEKLAYPIRKSLGEVDFPLVYFEPNKNVVEFLRKYDNVQDALLNLPSEL